MNLIAWMKWHRWAGFGIALFIVLLCLTGILLNHGSALGLARHYVHSDWLLDLYDIEPVPAPVSFSAGAHWVTRIGDHLYFDGRELAERSDTLLGVVPLQDQIVAGLGDRLLILAPDGATIEVLRATEGVPAGMKRIGSTADGRLAIDTARGQFLPDLDSLRWEQEVVSDGHWAVPAPLPAELNAKLVRSFRDRTVTLERLLLDIHSGRIMQRFGVWFMDLVAVVLLSLTLSGIWIWYRR
jgi:hypothetical protein